MQSKEFHIETLLTSINTANQRISMHGVRLQLLERQAKMIGLPLTLLKLPEMPDMESYENNMRATMQDLKDRGVSHSIFGDIFLEDLRKYREEKLAAIGLKATFPLWKFPTDLLIREFIDLGFKTIVTCVNDQYLDRSFCGRIIDHEFLNDLPWNVDPCGENGEFHTFVFEGPIFQAPIAIAKGEMVYKKYAPEREVSDKNSNSDEGQTAANPFDNGFWYCDILPADRAGLQPDKLMKI